MSRVVIYMVLIMLYAIFTAMVYTHGTDEQPVLAEHEMKLAAKGKELYQQNNCISCHQIYGLGGYLGPDLTTAWSDRHRGEPYLRAMLISGGSRMPAYPFTEQEINSIIAYLKYVDATATTLKPGNRQ